MTIFAITFRIADESSNLGTYGERWNSVNSAIQDRAVGRNYWKQTTSFFVLQANENTSTDLAKAIDQNSRFDRVRDLLVVINLDAKGYAVLGVNNDADLDKIMALRAG
jgi:hypothetical protein